MSDSVNKCFNGKDSHCSNCERLEEDLKKHQTLVQLLMENLPQDYKQNVIKSEQKHQNDKILESPKSCESKGTVLASDRDENGDDEMEPEM